MNDIPVKPTYVDEATGRRSDEAVGQSMRFAPLQYWRLHDATHWYGPAAVGFNFVGTTPSGNTLIAVPYLESKGGRLSDIGYQIIGASGTIRHRMGIYKSYDNTPYPATLVVDSGEFTGPGTKTQVVSVQLLRDTLYFLVFLHNSAALGLTVASVPFTAMPPLFGRAALSGGNDLMTIEAAQSYGALPQSFPAGGIHPVAPVVPNMMVRYAVDS